MPIQPVSGKIVSQELNNNFSYLESTIKNIDKGSPKGAYEKVADLVATYPNGDDGIYIITGNGYWYFWNGTSWEAGGVYQGTELRNGSVTGVKLDTQFRYKGYLNAGENLNQIVDDGAYLVGSIIGKPSGITGTIQVVENIKVFDRWIIQKIYDFNNPSVYWTRRIDQTTFTPSEWAKSINTPDIIAAKGSTVNVDSATEQGTYIVLATASGTFPDDWVVGSYAGTLFVTNENNRFVTQRLVKLNDPVNRYIRTIDTQTGNKYRWLKEPSLSPLAFKTIVCLGDSITEFGNYPEVIANRTGATVYNCGFGGTRLANHGEPNYDAFSVAKIVESIVSGDWSEQEEANATTGYTTTFDNIKNIDFNTVDHITIFAGTNDWAGTDRYGSVELGKDDDTTRETFKGAINYIIKTLLTAYPNIKITFFTPIWRSRIIAGDGHDSDIFPNRDGAMLIDFVDALINLGGKNHVSILDLYRNSGINKYNESNFLEDGVHPKKPKGYEHIGNKGSSFLIANY
ncbi:SGNH/GDSL hydrolase family protein [Lederbergia galactosidilytica]|uniref:SGNH/GDSL hydrolase family protein n=1 Tax=Lederbergia galactosidilytica TaxID=217031 RepID=UPI0007DB1665|nr:GDSL-type esterase/lipase family protein [Lederbergia galactosidilytica]